VKLDRWARWAPFPQNCFYRLEDKYSARVGHLPHSKTMLAFLNLQGGARRLWFLLSGSHGLSAPAWRGSNYELSVLAATSEEIDY
jgi:hypothetical protein